MNPAKFYIVWALFPLLAVFVRAQEARLTNFVRLTNREVALSLVATPGSKYRLDASTNLDSSNYWGGIVSFQSDGVNRHTDFAARAASARFYRAQQMTNGALVGDYLATTNGDVLLYPLYHASLLMTWKDKVIYSDPDDDPAYELRYPAGVTADLILITHEHPDHYAPPKLTALRKPTGVIIVPQRVYNMGSFASYRPNAFVLSYGQSTNVGGIHVLAVQGTNNNHALGVNNCYVLTIGGRKIFISGDTGDVPEIRSLTEIDVAFLSMNLPFTMNWLAATNVVRQMRPKVVYPYHYRDSGTFYTNPPLFKAAMSNVLDVEVRLRNWY